MADAKEVAAGLRADIIDYFGDRQICDQCGATVSSYGDQCNPFLDIGCDGFATFAAMKQAVTDRRAIIAEEKSDA